MKIAQTANGSFEAGFTEPLSDKFKLPTTYFGGRVRYFLASRLLLVSYGMLLAAKRALFWPKYLLETDNAPLKVKAKWKVTGQIDLATDVMNRAIPAIYSIQYKSVVALSDKARNRL